MILDRRFVDAASGKVTHWPRLEALLAFVREGDSWWCTGPWLAQTSTISAGWFISRPPLGRGDRRPGWCAGEWVSAVAGGAGVFTCTAHPSPGRPGRTTADFARSGVRSDGQPSRGVGVGRRRSAVRGRSTGRGSSGGRGSAGGAWRRLLRGPGIGCGAARRRRGRRPVEPEDEPGHDALAPWYPVARASQRSATGRSAGVPGKCAAATAAGRPPPGRR